MSDTFKISQKSKRMLSEGNFSTVGRISRSIQLFLQTLTATDHSVDHLRHCFRQAKCPAIDYDVHGVSFTHLYFLENYWKAAHAFTDLPLNPALNLIDVGSGSGATTLAYLASLESAIGDSRCTVNVLFLDRSKQQLNLAKNLINHIHREFRRIRIVPRFMQVDLHDWRPLENAAEVVLLGHVLTENLNDVNFLLEKAITAVSPNGCVYIVERAEDHAVWSTINTSTSLLAMSTATGVVHLDPSTVALEYPPTPTRYLRIQIPEQKNLPVLVRLYFQAWEEQSPELLERIFAFNAEYYEKPHEPPVRGIKQIQRYWAENVLQQRDIHTEILSVAYSRDLAFAEWHARFIKSNERVCLSGTMIFELDVQSLLVSSFREYFRSAKEQVDVQDRLAYSGSTD